MSVIDRRRRKKMSPEKGKAPRFIHEIRVLSNLVLEKNL